MAVCDYYTLVVFASLLTGVRDTERKKERGKKEKYIRLLLIYYSVYRKKIRKPKYEQLPYASVLSIMPFNNQPTKMANMGS